MFDPSSLIDLGLGAAALAGLRVFKRDMVAAVDRVGDRIDKLDTRVKNLEEPPAPLRLRRSPGFDTPATAAIKVR